MRDNLRIQTNLVRSSFRSPGFCLSRPSCIYPKFPQQPITEDALITGRLEATNE